jgi:peroxiredoxin Q/BCP
VILGISPDSVRKHQRFREKYGLPFTLVADPDHAIAEAYGVWKQKSMFGRKYWGVARSTFVIDPAGKVARVFPDVSIKGHAEAVLGVLQELAKTP